MTLTEQAPDYALKVAAYLSKSGGRRLPWGTIVAGGHLTYTATSADRMYRQELGESAIRMLLELGVTMEEIQKYDEKGPESCTQSKPSSETSGTSSTASVAPLPSTTSGT